MKKFLIISFIILGVTACSQDPWTKYEKDAFLDGCEEEKGGSYYCKCFMAKMMDKYPNYEDSHNISLEEAVELASECQ
ncbi:MAG: hypothetical protein MK078_17215 [Crocinitomicaceae bacterium]|nr:hypothetical protein [Crocinitomicaceae bacterium]